MNSDSLKILWPSEANCQNGNLKKNQIEHSPKTFFHKTKALVSASNKNRIGSEYFSWLICNISFFS